MGSLLFLFLFLLGRGVLVIGTFVLGLGFVILCTLFCFVGVGLVGVLIVYENWDGD